MICLALVISLVALIVAKRKNKVPESMERIVNDTAGGFINKLYFGTVDDDELNSPNGHSTTA